MLRFALFSLFAAVLAGSPLRAEILSYAIAVPQGTPSAFEIPILAAHPGHVILETSWTGSRLLSFRLVPGAPQGGAVLHRSGPSPQRVDFEITADQLKSGPMKWTLEIRAPGARGTADGSVTVTVPDAPEIVAAREEAERPPPPPPPVPDPWTLAVSPPDGASPQLALLFTRVESLRAAVFGDDPFTIHDACGWQADALRWLSEHRDALAAKKPALDNVSLAYLRRLAHALNGVEGMRTSTHPLIAGPVPKEPLRKKAWLIARRDTLRPIEQEFDSVTSGFRKREAPALIEERWLARLLACAISSENYFEAHVRLGPGNADGGDLAEAQWPRIVATAAALDALAAWLDVPPTP